MKSKSIMISIVAMTFPAMSFASMERIEPNKYYELTPELAAIVGIDSAKICAGPNEKVVIKFNEAAEIIDLRSIDSNIVRVPHEMMADHPANGGGGGAAPL